jgi:Holliday junction DNA helicase RuvA
LGLHIIYHATTNAPIPILIGFIRRGERVFFRKLMSVEGLGPTKAARALTISVSSMARAIEQENRDILISLPGIGRRAADKIIASLKGKVLTEASMQDSDQGQPIDLTSLEQQRLAKDAEAAILSLGYSSSEAKQWVENALIEDPTPENLESLMLKILRSRDN